MVLKLNGLTNASILRELTMNEQRSYFKIIQRYNSIIDKLNSGVDLTGKEDLFLLCRPHQINVYIDVDLIERTIVLIDYRIAVGDSNDK